MRNLRAFIRAIAVILTIASATAWAASQELPPLPALVQESTDLVEPAFRPPHELPPVSVLSPVKAWPGWQQFLAYREALRWFGGIILGLMVLLVLTHFAIYGYHHVRPTGRMVKRYSWVEVLLHDLLALSFVGAWVSSTYLVLAKYVLEYGEEELAVPFGRLTSTVHIASGLLFLGSLVALAVIWRPAMRFVSYDRDWLKRLGGYFSRGHQILPAGKFNAGQKIWFYVSILLGILVSVSGALIYYPALLGLRWGILLYAVHTALAVASSAMVIGHVYLAVLAHPRAVRAIITGEMDEACLREDHPLEKIPEAGEQAR
ncbi:MAG: cytochrome b/b6 domain-containing protein [Deltaproteobacteria bacterium]|nr:cytochrome b/b6 domain-containing protein [Deltaproteobacteria bacterium]